MYLVDDVLIINFKSIVIQNPNMCSSSALVCSCVLVGGAFLVASVSGIGFSLFLLFGDPFYGATDGTYDPSFEDIGKLHIYQIDFYLKQNMSYYP